MPTAAKLFAAVCFGFVGFFAAELARPAFPEGTRFGWFAVLAVGGGVSGLLAHWGARTFR